MDETKALLREVVKRENTVAWLMVTLCVAMTVTIGVLFFQLRTPPSEVAKKVDRNNAAITELANIVTNDRWTYSMQKHLWAELKQMNPDMKIPGLPPPFVRGEK